MTRQVPLPTVLTSFGTVTPLVTLIPVEPTGARTSPAFVERADPRRCGLEMVTFKTYPEPARQLREWRVEGDMSLRECAALLGLKASEVSALERGSATLSDADWGVVENAVKNTPRRSRP